MQNQTYIWCEKYCFGQTGMRKSIQDMCAACDTCAQYSTATPKEPMRSLPIPTRPWQIVNQDIYELHNQRYLVTTQIGLRLTSWEIPHPPRSLRRQKPTLHNMVFQQWKRCHTDNSSQFISEQYRKFSKEHGFKHTNSSPYHHKGNRRAEAAVKVAEPMIKRADDFHSALRLYRDTPNLGAHILTCLAHSVCSYDALEPYCLPLIISWHLP